MIIGLMITIFLCLITGISGIRGLIIGIREKDIDIIILSFMPIIIGIGFLIGFINELIII